MIVPNRKCPLVLVVLTGCLYICDAQNTDACANKNVIQLQNGFGHVESGDTKVHGSLPCQLWSIQGELNDTITVRISVAHFDKAACAAGSNLILGPLPYLDICALHTVHFPVMYRSKRDHMWIKYVIGSESWGPLVGSNFALDYVTSSSKRCNFKCILDDKCVPEEWQCNGQPECPYGEDEYMCSGSTEVDEPPHAVTSPDVIIRYPQTTFTLYGDRSTDDHGIVRYTWTKSSKDALSCDLKGTRTSVLQLSNLQVGEYTFTLTVTDKIGQTSSADVHVIVRPAAYQDKPKTTTLSSKPTTTAKPSCFRCFIVFYGQYACLPSKLLCDGIAHCRDGLDEEQSICEKHRPTTTRKPPSTTCAYHEIYCYSIEYRQLMCLHNMYKCDGITHCAGGEDENPVMCGDSVCNKRLEDSVGWFASPSFPRSYPQHSSCSWVIHKQASGISSTIQLRIVAFSLEREPDTDYVKVYDGPDSTYKLIGTYYGLSPPPNVIESSSNWLNVVFKSDYFGEYGGFNFTYQIKGQCLPSQIACEGEYDCYDALHERCNGIWNCPLKGSDEIGCGNCKDDYTCGLQTSQCYHPTERCNGLARCSNSFDEINCTSELCGTHNGTFLCDNKRCIYESWTCDERDDCGDSSDEQFCTGTTKRVIIAAICGSMICALLLVILLGCSCKLYSLRTMDHHHRYPRHETPMSRLYAEFLRRRAPPPYHEAMLTSRNFDEVQQEYLERMRNSRRNHRGRGNRRRSRNQQTQSQTDTGDAVENQSNTNNENSENIHEGTSGMQLCTISEENENENHVNAGRTSSTAELLPSDSETDSDSDDNESETDLAEQGEGHSEDQNRTNNRNINRGDDDDDDVENILASTSLSAQWMRNADSEDSSDDICILGNSSPENMLTSDTMNSRGQGLGDNASIDTEATASIASIEHQDILNTENLFKDSENESDTDDDAVENSRNSTPKPDSNRGNAVISETNGDFIRRANSQGSLSSEGSETFSENDVPLLPMNSVVSQHF